jgi:PAS domain S-box-containing protein
MPTTRSRAARDIWWIFLGILIVNAGLVGANTWRMARQEADVNHSLSVLNALNQLQAQLGDGETGARGFLITGNEEFLDLYFESTPRLPAMVEELRRLTLDNEPQQREIAALSPLLERRLKLLEQTVDAGRKPIPDPAEGKDLVAQGKRVMDEIRVRLQSMREEEDRLLDRRRVAAKGTLTTAVISAVVGGLLTIGMLILTNYLIRREVEVRRRGEVSLQRSEERFRLIAESLPQFVWVARPDGHLEFCNRRWLEYTGQSPEKSLGYGWSSPLNPDDRESYERLWKQALATGEPLNTEARFQKSDGESRWFLVRVVPLRDRAGQVERWLGTAGDIHDQKQANETLETHVRERTVELQRAISELLSESEEREKTARRLQLTAAELRRSNEELEKFAYVASHDLQEPLRKIQAFGDRLKIKCRDQLDEQGREYIDRMQSSATRMRRLIDDLLTFSRVSTRPMPLAEVDLNEVAHEVESDLEDTILRSQAAVDIGPMPIVQADPLQMRQLIQNLLTNALKFHKPGEPPHVTIRAVTLPGMPHDSPGSPPQPAVRIDVTDRGIGFENEFRDRIFELFQRLHGRNEYEGTGIGLAVVRKIAERHGGFVTANGEPGNGATFSVVLPMNGSGRKNDPMLNGEASAERESNDR